MIGFRQVLVFVALVATCSAQQVTCETTKGVFTIDMHREWAPIGYDRFMQVYLFMVKIYFQEILLLVVCPRF